MKQNKKAKNYAVFCFAGKKKLLFYIYAVIVKQNFYKRSTNHYLTHDRIGSSSHVQQNGLLSRPQDLDAPLRFAAQRKINGYRQQYADNHNISFLPAIVSTSTGMHGEFFYQSLKSKIGLAAAKAAALRINLNVEGCGIVAAPVHAPSRAPLLLPLLLSHNLPLPRAH
jgi:hypothetical protein